ncbi:MAG: DUF1761 domain-containing protein [Acidobacteriota bacterium]
MLHDLNWLAVLVAGVAFFMVGSVWYSALFGKPWQRLVGIDPETAGGNLAAIFGTTLVLEILASGALAHLVQLSGYEGWKAGLHVGLIVGLCCVAPAIAINNLFQRRPFALTAIDGGHMAVGLAVAGTIVGAWR